MTETELCKEFPYNKNYLIYADGKVFNKTTGRFLNPTINYKRYRIVNIDGKTYGVHRVVAITFLENPNNLPMVNHKDEDPSNNHIDNLEWCTSKYNQNYHRYINGDITKEQLDSYNSPIYINTKKAVKSKKKTKHKNKITGDVKKPIIQKDNYFRDYYKEIDEIYKEARKNELY